MDKTKNSGRIFVAKNRNGPDGMVFPIFMDTSNVKINVLKQDKNAFDKPSTKLGKNVLRQKYVEYMTKNNINTEIINTISHVKRSRPVIPLTNWIFFILFPIITDVKNIGVKPIKVAKRNLNFEISNNDRIIFCAISGSHGNNRKIIRYSNDEWEINLLMFWAYFS